MCFSLPQKKRTLKGSIELSRIKCVEIVKSDISIPCHYKYPFQVSPSCLRALILHTLYDGWNPQSLYRRWDGNNAGLALEFRQMAGGKLLCYVNQLHIHSLIHSFNKNDKWQNPGKLVITHFLFLMSFLPQGKLGAGEEKKKKTTKSHKPNVLKCS